MDSKSLKKTQPGRRKHLSIRSRLLLSYSIAFLTAFSLGIFIIFTMVRTTIEKNIEKELQNSTRSILNMVKSAVNASIKNHLRAIAEKNKEIVGHLYGQFKTGRLSETEAKKIASELLLSQSIGKSGYIYCINSFGIIKVHPKDQLLNSNLTAHSFIREQIVKREGYIEYDWANPGESIKRGKALYMVYFEPWDWIISVSSYREEFSKLISVSDFQENILSITFGTTGYPYVINSKGDLIIHPKLQGSNIIDATDDNGRMFIKQMCETKNGKIIYPWKNPGESKPREKLVLFNYIPEMDWIVASSSYLEEFYKPLFTIGYIALVTGGLMLLLIVPISWWISKTISEPLEELIHGFDLGTESDFSYRMKTSWGSEMDWVGHTFNDFMAKLETTSQKLHESELKFRSIFENSVEGIFQSTLDGKFITVNPAMATMFGYGSPENLIKRITDMATEFYVNPEDKQAVIKILDHHDTLDEYQVKLYTKNKKEIWCSLSATAYRDEQGNIDYIEGFLTDITQRKHHEEYLKQTNQELELRVLERTKELSNWVSELEERNAQSTTLREMSELVQVCKDHQETYLVISRFLKRFFPGDSGQLFILEKKEQFLETVINWGESSSPAPPFFKDDCWALRQGKPYVTGGNEDVPACTHISKSSNQIFICIPMVNQGKIMGMLFVTPAIRTDLFSQAQVDFKIEQKQRLAVTIVEHLALALANLNLRETLKRQSLIDPLTGLYNRRFLEEFLKTEFHNINRHHYSVGIIMIDVDNFKSFNDQFGHECGDVVLHELGLFLKAHKRSGDIICRFGGEEFVMVLIKSTVDGTISRAKNLCRKVREELSIHHNGKIHKITISLGVSVCPEHSGTFEETISLADAALYKAKSNGRDRVEAHGN